MSVSEHPSWRRARGVSKFLLAFIVVLLLVALAATLLLPNLDAVASARAGLDRYSMFLMLVRLAVIGVLWLCWVPLMNWLYRNSAPKALAYMQSRRNNFAIVFLAIELLLIQNVLGWLWRLIGS